MQEHTLTRLGIMTNKNISTQQTNTLLNKEGVSVYNEEKGGLMKTLAQFIQHRRDEIGFSPKGLAKECNLPLSLIEDIESGKELFLPVTVRQNLAKVLKCDPHEIKELEKDYTSYTVSQEIIDSLKELILNGAGGLKCPKCGAPLVTRIARLYDLEDNLMLHPKAHCSKCSFHITE